MTRRLPQSTSATIMLKLFATSDHISPSSGSTVGVKISKNCGAFSNLNAGATNATEVDSTGGPGWYKVAFDSTDLNTLGDFVIRGTATACDASEQICHVVATTAGVNLTQIAGVAVDTTSPQLGVRVNNIVANAVDTTSAQLGVRLVNIGASAVNSTSAQLGVNLVNIAGSAVDTTSPQLGVRLNNIVAAAVDTTSPQLGVRLVNVGASAVSSASAQIGANVVSIASGAVTSTAFTTDAIGSTQLASTAVIKISDGLLDRDMSIGGDTGTTTVRTVRQALRFLRNKWSITAGTLTVCKEDDTAASWTAAMTTDSTASPITAVDPAG